MFMLRSTSDSVGHAPGFGFILEQPGVGRLLRVVGRPGLVNTGRSRTFQELVRWRTIAVFLCRRDLNWRVYTFGAPDSWLLWLLVVGLLEAFGRHKPQRLLLDYLSYNFLGALFVNLHHNCNKCFPVLSNIEEFVAEWGLEIGIAQETLNINIFVHFFGICKAQKKARFGRLQLALIFRPKSAVVLRALLLHVTNKFIYKFYNCF